MLDLNAELAARERSGLRRRQRVLAPAGPARVRDEHGRVLRVFCSNDYLGLAGDPRPAEAMARAGKHGAGAGAAHLLGGHRPEHAELEAACARLAGRDRALVFASGYAANVAVIDALTRRGDHVLQDRLNHASLIDGARLAGARLRRYRHGDVDHLARCLARVPGDRTLVVTDGVFSMDGDVAPLAALAERTAAHRAWLMVDDAHGFGVLGAGGGGSVAAAALGVDAVPVLVGTLGKAFGVGGAFVAGDEALIEFLVQAARPWVYSTAMPPPMAAAATEAVAIAERESWRRDHLQALVRRFRAGAGALGLSLMPSETPIQPLVIGDSTAALAASDALERAGFLVSAVRPPTVPRGSARLRVTLSAAHEPGDVDALLAALADLPLPEQGQ
ncbi:8-amino-7-oxononanoate synthase [Arhodomonas sp. AD133]|uniref:8-amino-7-oxononanoate synthase n=1 Tax=Arhodomonas sp. AD133 TaxID=3415009 RepID=UPI003EBB5336